MKKALLVIPIVLVLIVLSTSCKPPASSATPAPVPPSPAQTEKAPASPVKTILEQFVTAAQGATILSNDASLTLEIPPGALPQDTTVTASVVPEDDWDSEMNSLEPLQVLKLDAGGSDFNEPVKVTMRLEAEALEGRGLPPGAYPACFIFTRGNEGTWDVLADPITEIDADTGEMVITGQASHFSHAVVHASDLATLIYPTSEEKFVGESWTPKVTVYNFSDDQSYKIVPIGYLGLYSVGNIGPKKAMEFELGPGENKVLDPPPIFDCHHDGDGYYTANIMAWVPFGYWEARKFVKETHKFPESIKMKVRGTAVCKVPFGESTSGFDRPLPTPVIPMPVGPLEPITPTPTANGTGETEGPPIRITIGGTGIDSWYIFEDDIPILNQALHFDMEIKDLTGGANEIVDGGWVVTQPESVSQYLELDWKKVLTGSPEDDKCSGPLEVQQGISLDMPFKIELDPGYFAPGNDLGIVIYGINAAGQQQTAMETIPIPEPPPPPEAIEVLYIGFKATISCPESGCTLGISYEANDLTGGKMPVTGVVVTVNGAVWGDSGAIDLPNYESKVTQAITPGSSYNIEITAYNNIGLHYTTTGMITAPTN